MGTGTKHPHRARNVFFKRRGKSPARFFTFNKEAALPPTPKGAGFRAVDRMMPAGHPQIQRTSMGSWKHVDIRRDEAPRPWIALETAPKASAFDEWIYPKGCTIVVGNEERGIRSSLLKQCDAIVCIPLSGHKNSLNVANAYAIVAAEAAMQHRRPL